MLKPLTQQPFSVVPFYSSRVRWTAFIHTIISFVKHYLHDHFYCWRFFAQKQTAPYTSRQAADSSPIRALLIVLYKLARDSNTPYCAVLRAARGRNNKYLLFRLTLWQRSSTWLFRRRRFIRSLNPVSISTDLLFARILIVVQATHKLCWIHSLDPYNHQNTVDLVSIHYPLRCRVFHINKCVITQIYFRHRN